jgi:hypothetical protein
MMPQPRNVPERPRVRLPLSMSVSEPWVSASLASQTITGEIKAMNENDHGMGNGNEEEYVNPCVLEVRRIREEIRREFNYDSDAFIECANREAGTVTGKVWDSPPPPRPFPPSQEYHDFVSMLDKQEKEKRRKRKGVAAQRAETPARPVAGVGVLDS